MGAYESTDNAIFLDRGEEIWAHLTLWCMLCTSSVFFWAGLVGARVRESNAGKVFFPLAMGFLGGATGFFQGAIPAAFLAAIYRAIPYTVGIDTAAGLGVGIGLLILFFQFGRGDFVHQ